MTPDELREAAAIARRWRETQGRTRQQRIEATRVEAETAPASSTPATNEQQPEDDDVPF